MAGTAAGDTVTSEDKLALIEKEFNTPEQKRFLQVAMHVITAIGVEEFAAATTQKTPEERELAVYRLYFKFCVTFVKQEDANAQATQRQN